MSKKAFTLIELLVVVAVLALLASIVFSNLGGAREGARISNALSFQSQTHSLLGSDLIGWWNFNDSDDRYKDISGYDNHGSCTTNCPIVTDGVPGTGGDAMEFDGVENYILLNDWIMDRLIINSFSISFWLNSNNVTGLTRDVFGGGNYGNTYGGVAFSHHSGNNWYYDIYIEPSGRKALVISDSTNLIPFEQWSHIVLTRDRLASNSAIFVNGKRERIRTDVNGEEDIRWNKSSFPLKIGKGHYNSTDGFIDDFRIYSRAQTASEIQTLYAQTKDKYLADGY